MERNGRRSARGGRGPVAVTVVRNESLPGDCSAVLLGCRLAGVFTIAVWGLHVGVWMVRLVISRMGVSRWGLLKPESRAL